MATSMRVEPSSEADAVVGAEQTTRATNAQEPPTTDAKTREAKAGDKQKHQAIIASQSQIPPRPPIPEGPRPLWKVCWYPGVRVRVGPSLESPTIGSVQHGRLFEGREQRGDWLQHDGGWSLIVNRRTRRTLLRVLKGDELELWKRVRRFEAFEREHKTLVARSTELKRAHSALVKSREAFSKSVAVLGSHSKAAAAATAAAQDFYLSQASLSSIEQMYHENLELKVVLPLSHLTTEAQHIRTSMKPVETIISTIERCQDAVVFSVDEARAKVAADELDSVRQKGSLLIDQLSNAISSLLQKKTTILTTSLGKLNKDRLVSSQRTSKALQRGDWNKAHQDVDSAKATGSKTIQQSKPENVEGKDVKTRTAARA